MFHGRCRCGEYIDEAWIVIDEPVEGMPAEYHAVCGQCDELVVMRPQLEPSETERMRAAGHSCLPGFEEAR